MTKSVHECVVDASPVWRYQYVSEMLDSYKRTFSLLAADPRARVRMFWSSPDLDLAGYRREFMSALHRRINRKVAPVPQWRKLDPKWQASAMRDRNRLRDIAKRIRVYQFETNDARQRFGDQLSRYDD